MKRVLVTAIAVLSVAACGQGQDADATVATDTLTRRQKDSLVSTIPVAGAGRIGDAQRSVDRINARTQVHDTMR